MYEMPRKRHAISELVCSLCSSIFGYNHDRMNYKEKFEDEGFVYELTVQSAGPENEDLRIYSQSDGFYCQWAITTKENNFINEVAVTDDECEVIVYASLEAAVRGAKEFLSI